jgi:hypothetical protein
MNRHERRARAAQERGRAAHWRAGAPGEIHVDGGYEEGINRAGGEQNVVTVAAALMGSNASVKSAIPLDMIDPIMADMAKVEAEVRRRDGKRVDPRQSAMSFIVDAFKAGKHLTQPTGSSVVSSLLWLACAKPGVGRAILEHAKRGGTIISWEITEGGKGYGNNWRLILDGLPGDATHVPVPKHPLPTTPGGPALVS